MKTFHTPAMLKEVLEIFDPHPGEIYVDATLGGGGHAQEILKKIQPNGKLIGIDLDPEALEFSKKKLEKFRQTTDYVQGIFSDIKVLIPSQSTPVEGILFDLGTSSYQIGVAERGFSLRQDGPLDMRMNQSTQTTTAADLISDLDQRELIWIIKEYGEERFAKRIVNAIVRTRQKKRIKKTLELAEIIKNALPPSAPKRKLDSVTRVFQALRIAVNKELENLEKGLRESFDLLKPGGKIIVISYHSLEDRIVKNIFKEEARDCICPPKTMVCSCAHKKKIKVLTPKPMTPTTQEVKNNSRVRSAKLRAAQKI